MTSSSATSPRSYLDFEGLAGLRGDASRSPDKAVRKTAEQFEAYLIQQMMKTMRESVEKSELLDSGHMEMYQDLMDKEVAMQMVRRGGMGLADMLEKQILQQQQASALSTQEALQLRTSGKQPSPLPLQPAAQPLPLQPDRPKALPLQRAGAYELHRRSEGQP